MNIGDVVLVKGYNHEMRGVIVEKNQHVEDTWEPRYKVRIFSPKSIDVSGRNMQTWVGEKDIELDIQYIRDIKINEVLS